MFNDRRQELRISCDFKLATDERNYIATGLLPVPRTPS
jgi:hypothetical protein